MNSLVLAFPCDMLLFQPWLEWGKHLPLLQRGFNWASQMIWHFPSSWSCPILGFSSICIKWHSTMKIVHWGTFIPHSLEVFEEKYRCLSQHIIADLGYQEIIQLKRVLQVVSSVAKIACCSTRSQSLQGCMNGRLHQSHLALYYTLAKVCRMLNCTREAS